MDTSECEDNMDTNNITSSDDDFLVVSDMSGNVPNFTVVLCNETNSLNQNLVLNCDQNIPDVVDEQLIMLHNKMTEMFSSNVIEENNTSMYYIENSCAVHESGMTVESSAVELSDIADACNAGVKILDSSEHQKDIDLNELDLEKFVTFIVEESDHETSYSPQINENTIPELNVLLNEAVSIDNSINHINLQMPEISEVKKREKTVMPSGLTLNNVQEQYGPDVSSQYIFMKRYFCSLCGRDFYNKSTFSTHVDQSHDKKVRKNIKIILKLVRVFDCDICDKCFCGRDKLKRHIDKLHSLEEENSNTRKEKKYSHSSPSKGYVASGSASAYKSTNYTDRKHRTLVKSPRKSQSSALNDSNEHKRRKLSHSLDDDAGNFISNNENIKNLVSKKPQIKMKINKKNENNSKINDCSEPKFDKVKRNVAESKQIIQKSKKCASNSVKMPRITKVESLAQTRAIVSSSKTQNIIECTYCFKSFRNEISLNIHSKYCMVSKLCTDNFHRGVKTIEQERYFCPACDIHYKFKTNVKQHLTKKHPKNKYHVLNKKIFCKKTSMLICNLCTNVYRCAQELLTHVKNKHIEDYDSQVQILQQLLLKESKKQGIEQLQETEKEDTRQGNKSQEKCTGNSPVTTSINSAYFQSVKSENDNDNASSSCNESTEITSLWKCWSGRSALWKCDLCSQNFKDKYALREHKDNAHNKTQVKPVDPPQETESIMNSNLWDYLQVKPPKAAESILTEEFPAVSTETYNYILVQAERYFCPKCDTHFSLSANAIRHIKNVHSKLQGKHKVTRKITEMFQCLHCLKLCLLEGCRSKLCANFKKRVSDNTTIQAPKFKCDYCNKVFLSSETLSKHLQNAHYDLIEINKTGIEVMKKRYYCSQCPKHYSCHTSCKMHILSMHGASFCKRISCKNTKLWFCTICRKKKSIQYFKSLRQYVDHIKNNHGVSCIKDTSSTKPDIFSVESEDFNLDFLPLKKVVTAYICPQCSKPFKHPNSIYLHFRNKHDGSFSTSTMIKKIMQMGRCKKCPQYFFFKANLQQHELTCNSISSSHFTVPQQMELMPQHLTPMYNEETSIELKHSIFPTASSAAVIKEEPKDDYETQPTIQEFEHIELTSDIKIECEGMEEPVPQFDLVAPDECLESVNAAVPESHSVNSLDDISMVYQLPTKVIRTRYCCTFCPRHFSCCTAIRDHIKSVHKKNANMKTIAKKEISMLLCKACPLLSKVKYFVSEEIYNIHFNYKHLKIGVNVNTNDKMKVASVKKNTTKVKYNLNMRVVFAYVCTDCNTPYLSRQKMKLHLKSSHEASSLHHSEIPKQLIGVFKCNKCQQYFFHKSELHQHSIQIHGKVPVGLQFNNDQENSELRTIDKLIMKISTERFYCPHCSKHFSWYKSCRLHISKLHSQDKETTIATKITDLWLCTVCPNRRNRTYFASKVVCESHCKLKHKICLDEETFIEKPQASFVSQQQHKTSTDKTESTPCETHLTETQMMQKDSVISLQPTYDTEDTTQNDSNLNIDKNHETQHLEQQEKDTFSKVANTSDKEGDLSDIQEPQVSPKVSNNSIFNISKVNVKRYFCPMCDLHFQTQSECTSHQTSTHPKVAKYMDCKMTGMHKCNTCSTYSNTSLDLEQHICKKLNTNQKSINNKTSPKVRTRTNEEILSDKVCLKRYVCPNCDKNFSSYYSCRDHNMFVHCSFEDKKIKYTDVDLWMCTFCPNLSNTKYSLTKELHIQHLQKKHQVCVEIQESSANQTGVECDQCGQNFTDKYILNEHKIREHSQVIALSNTAYHIPQKKAVVVLERISIELNDNGPFSASEFLKKVEKRNITSGRKIDSTSCQSQSKDLIQVKQYLCPQCAHVSDTFNSTVEHIKIKHPEIEITAAIKKKVSTITTNKVQSSSKHEHCSDVCMNLDDNDKKIYPVRRHVKAYLCQECKKPCLTSETLKTHVNSNHKSIFYNNSLTERKSMCIVKCNFCSRCFFYKSSLLNHERTHRTPKLKLSCSHCDKTFTSEDYLKTHQFWKHTVEDMKLKILGPNDAKLMCDICSEMCDSKLLLERHMKKQHGVVQKNGGNKTAIKTNKRKVETPYDTVVSEIKVIDSNVKNIPTISPVKKQKLEVETDAGKMDLIFETIEIKLDANNDNCKTSPSDTNGSSTSNASPVKNAEITLVKSDLSMEINDLDLNKDHSNELTLVDKYILETKILPNKSETSIDMLVKNVTCETSQVIEKEVEKATVKHIDIFNVPDTYNVNSNDNASKIQISIKPLTEKKVSTCFGSKIDKICNSVTTEVDPTIVINVSDNVNTGINDTQLSKMPSPGFDNISMQDVIIVNVSPEPNPDTLHPLNFFTQDFQIQNNMNINSSESISKIDTAHFNVNPLRTSLISQITRNKPLICQYCNTQFSTLNKFLMHVNLHLKLANQSSIEIVLPELNLQQLENSIKVNTDQPIQVKSVKVNPVKSEKPIKSVTFFMCKLCDMEFKNNKLRVKHLRDIHQLFFCTTCQEFINICVRKQHYKFHKQASINLEGIPLLRCEFCQDIQFKSKICLKYHIIKQHFPKKPLTSQYTCFICNKKMASRISLKNHILKIHSHLFP